MSEADDVGSILTGGVIAREVERVGMPGEMPSEMSGARREHGGHGGACLNCGAVLTGDFCARCGQSAHLHKTMMSIVHDILHGVFHFEGRFWSTLPLLVRHPGALTRRYIDGERVRFVSPMALFLFSVFLLFAAVNRIAMPDVSGLGQGMTRLQDQMAEGVDQLGDKVSALKEKRADALEDDPKADTRQLDQQIGKAQDDLAKLRAVSGEMKRLSPAEQARRWDAFAAQAGQKWLRFGTGMAAEAAHQAEAAGRAGAAGAENAAHGAGGHGLARQVEFIRENPDLYAYKLKMASYKYSWALIPISVPLIAVLFAWRRQYGLYDHAIFAIYSLSFMTLLAVGLIGLFLLGVPASWLLLVGMIVPPIHMYKQLKGAYRLRRLSAAWRTLALLVMTSVAGSLFFALILWLEAE